MQEDIIFKISDRLKSVRKTKNLTLQQLSEMVGISKGMLSQVENSRTIPSLNVFFSLIKALQVDLNEFFQDIYLLAPGSRVIFKKNNQYQTFEKENSAGFHYKRILSTKVNDYLVDVVLLTVECGAKRLPVKTDAFEYKYLIEGEIEYIVGMEKFAMQAGDSIFFDASDFHNLHNTGQCEATLLVIYFFVK